MVSGNHSRPIGAPAQGFGACGETNAVSRQRPRPFPPDPEEVVSIRPVAMQENDEALRSAAGGGLKAGTIDHAAASLVRSRRAR